jgi:hypothetical protein
MDVLGPAPARRRVPARDVGCACVALGLFVGFWVWQIARVDRLMRPRPVALAEVERLTGLRFPSGTILAGSSYTSFPHASLEAKLQFGAQGAQQFTRTPPLAGKWTKGEPPVLPTRWWTPAGPDERVSCASVPTPLYRPKSPGQTLQVVDVVLVGKPRSGAVVYVQASGN